MRAVRVASVLFIIMITVIFAKAQIVLNEFVAMNQTGLTDASGNVEDWIEIANVGDENVNLGGYSLSIDSAELDMWIMPSRLIEPGGHLIVFASEKNQIANELHSNFKLDSENGRIILSNDFDQIIDDVSWSRMLTDISKGRDESNPDVWVYFREPTPGAGNFSQAYHGICPAPTFSVAGGLANSPISLGLEIEGEGEIRYTFGGFEPQESSPLYESLLEIVSTTIVRARGFAADRIPSEIVTHSYFFDESPSMALISLVTHPPNLWDEDIGIYVLGDSYDPAPPHVGANFWEDWSRPAHIEFFEANGNLAFAQDIGIKIYGGWNRSLPQKSLRLMAKSEFGPKSINYQVFPDKNIARFKSLLLRNSGNDWTVTHFRDAMMTGHVADTALDRQAYRPAIVFFNGEYMGIHNVRERIDTHYLATNHDLDREEIDLLEKHSAVIEGANEDYLSLLSFIESHDLSEDVNYQYVCTQMDVKNFAAYNIVKIFFGNTDWPAHNREFWRSQGPEGLWRWLLFDLDFGLGRYLPPSHNTLAWALEENSDASANQPWSTLMLRKLLKNTEFRQYFVALYADWLNSRFLSSELLAAVDVHRNLLIDEMPRHLVRWDRSMFAWEGSIDNMCEYILERPDNARRHMMEVLDLPDTLKLVLDVKPANAGRIELTGHSIDSYWTGVYFQGNPINLKAVPAPGFRFKYWSGSEDGRSDELSLDLSESSVLVANFEAEDFDDSSVVFNEINYHSSASFDSGDWVELVNRSEEDQDLSDWTFKDDNDEHAFTIPPGTILHPGEFLILCQDLSKFRTHFPNVTSVLGSFEFGLNGSGEMLRLFNWAGESADWVLYSDRSPWTSKPDGNGPTLELISIDFDNNLPESWTHSEGHGTPGEDNGIDELEAIEHRMALLPPFPSPFNPTCTIQFSIGTPGPVRLTVYDIKGRELECLIDGQVDRGEHRLTWRPTELASGIYLIRLVAGDETHEQTAILLK